MSSVRAVFERRDYETISSLVEPRSRVLDLGCGDGALLEWLLRNKHCDARGVELDGNLVKQAITRGASVYQGDMAQSLGDYPDQAFDYVILSQTLQQVARPLSVLKDMLRVGRKVIVGFPNFAHWSVRVSLLLNGRMPKNPMFPYEWHASPNIHMLTVLDFEALCKDQSWTVEKRLFLGREKSVTHLANLRAETAVYLLRK
jgi:methionine biosynthesis protein MetW